ncbi:MAG: DNA polymerase III subunit beta [Candidatus Subteraquimicrobiales bacterium]|nr:DNA polymerase III subunit beta [Candidatus Subteraquimicrobiales bacterium]
MKFKCLKNDILNATQIVQKAVSTRSTLPILTGILLQLKDKQIKLSATDLEIAIEYELEIDGEIDGSVVVPAKIFGDIIKNLPESIITMDATKSPNQINIVCERSSFSIKTLPWEDFPKFPEIDNLRSFSLESDLLGNAIKQVSKATSRDDTRPVLTGVLINVVRDKLKMVATDSYRLAVREVKVEDIGEDRIKIIVPGRTLDELSKILPGANTKVVFGVTESQIVFRFGGLTLISRLIEGEFPNYQQLLPESYNVKLEINKDELTCAIKRVSLIAASNIPVKLYTNKNLMRISTQVTDVGGAIEEISIKGPEEKMEISFNWQYLLDGVVSVQGDKVILEIVDALKPGMIRSPEAEDFLYLVMPVRIS